MIEFLIFNFVLPAPALPALSFFRSASPVNWLGYPGVYNIFSNEHFMHRH
jgi:hypothetical protein